MKKKLFATILLALYVLTGCTAPSEPSELDKTAKEVEQALPSEYEKQDETVVYLFPFANGEGTTLEYYLCRTTYYAADPDTITGLNTAAICAVFDVEDTPVAEELTICGYPAAFYQGEDRSYLCCTPSPETSLVLEYDPESISKEEALRTVQSVFENPQQ